jgi:hypothetical protein
MQNKSLVSNSVIHRYQAELEDKREFVHLKVVEKYNLEDKKKDISRGKCYFILNVRESVRGFVG